MAQDIGTYIRTCPVCAVVKRGVLQPAAPLRPQTAVEPWQTISVDILGPYPKTIRGHRFAIIAEDVFSKWVEVAPVPDGRVKTILDFLNHHVFARWGYPKTIITDNAVVFYSNLWRRKMDELRIEHRTSPVYHQQANPVERRVQELKKILRTRSDSRRPNRWDQAIADALFCLRTRANAATGTTPSELLLGYTLRRPGEEVREGDVADPVERQAQQARRERIGKVRRRQVIYQEKIFPAERRATTQFQAGEKVLAREPTVAGQPFHPTWSGPWSIVEVKGDNTYSVEKSGKVMLIHVNDLRAAVQERADPVIGQPPPEDDEPLEQLPGPLPGPSHVEMDVPNESEVPQQSVPDPGAECYRLPGSIPAPAISRGSI